LHAYSIITFISDIGRDLFYPSETLGLTFFIHHPTLIQCGRILYWCSK